MGTIFSICCFKKKKNSHTHLKSESEPKETSQNNDHPIKQYYHSDIDEKLSNNMRNTQNFSGSISSNSDEKDCNNENPPETEFPIQEKTISVPGLPNLGNTCYLNSVLQGLLHSTSFVTSFLEFIRRNKQTSEETNPITTSFYEFINSISSDINNTKIALKQFKNILGSNLDEDYSSDDQKDAYELLGLLIQTMHNETMINIEEFDPSNPKNLLIYEKSSLKENFCIILKNETVCQRCSYQDITYEETYNLSMPVDSEVNNISQCLVQMTKLEEISGFECPNCQDFVESTRQSKIWHAPEFIILHMQKFTFNDYGNRVIMKKGIQFPEKGLDISRNKTDFPNNENKLYDLYAVINHKGSFDAGHYYAYCLEDNWKCFNDQLVSDIDFQEILKDCKDSLILFYKKSC